MTTPPLDAWRPLSVPQVATALQAAPPVRPPRHLTLVLEVERLEPLRGMRPGRLVEPDDVLAGLVRGGPQVRVRLGADSPTVGP